MQQTKRAVEDQDASLGETLSHFAVVLDGIGDFRTETIGIKEQTAACKASRQTVVDAVSQLSVIAQKNADSAEQTVQSMGQLNTAMHQLAGDAVLMKELSVVLGEKVCVFKL